MQFDLKKDLIGAALVWLIFTASPHTGAVRPLVSLVLGLVIASIYLLARGLMRPRLPHLFNPEPVGPRGRLFAPPTASVWLLFVATTLVFLPTLRWLYGEYTLSIWRNGHGLFLPVVAILIARARLREQPGGEADSSLWGGAVLLVAATLAVLDSGFQSGLLGTVGLILALPGLSLLLLGPARTRAIAFPLALGAFLFPMPDHLPDPLGLTRGTCFMMEKYFHLIDVSAYRHQNYFVLSSGIFNVSTNCAGLSFFYAAYFFASLLAYFTKSPLRRIAILLSPWPITVVINGVRGTVLIATSNIYGSGVTDSFLHGLSGIATFWLIIATLFLLADWRYLLGGGRE